VKIRPVRAELFPADRQKNRRTDQQPYMTKLLLTLGSFVNAPKVYYFVSYFSKLVCPELPYGVTGKLIGLLDVLIAVSTTNSWL
jgi:hypothetical protein